MKKTADPLITGLLAAGLGAGSHLAANAIVGGLRHGASSSIGVVRRAAEAFKQRSGRKLGEGIRAGIAGEPRTFADRALDIIMAPELGVPKLVGSEIGANLRNVSAARRHKILKKLRKTIGSSPELHGNTQFHEIFSGANHALKSGRLPAKGKVRTLTRAELAAPYAAAAGLAVAKPALIPHAAVNKIRSAIGDSAWGKRYMRNDAILGGAGVVFKDAPLSKAGRVATGLIVSPALNDANNAGASFARLSMRSPGEAARFASAITTGSPTHAHALDQIRAQAEGLRVINNARRAHAAAKGGDIDGAMRYGREAAQQALAAANKKSKGLNLSALNVGGVGRAAAEAVAARHASTKATRLERIKELRRGNMKDFW